MAVPWTEARDAQLRRLRAEGALWAEVGRELGVSVDVARERARRIGVRRPVTAPRQPANDDPMREPLPAGHPRAWRLLTDDTLMQGEPWPGYPTTDIVGAAA